MDGLPSRLPDNPAALKRLLHQQQRTLEQQRKDLDRKQRLADRRQQQIERLEERLRRLLAHRFGRRSEQSPDQFQLFNEAELLADLSAEPAAEEIDMPAQERGSRAAERTAPG